MSTEKLYIEKELSWLSFNERVLQEAADKKNPLIQRIQFLGIYSNNLDEFYKVRFSDVKKRLFIRQVSGSPSSSAKQLLKRIETRVRKAELLFDNLYNEILLEMARSQLFLINEKQLTELQQVWLKRYFHTNLRRHVTPILLTSDINLVQFLKDDHTYLVVEMIHKQTPRYALLNIPSNKHSRFVLLPSESNKRRKKAIILLDNIIRFCLEDIFKSFFDFDKIKAYSMKMTRDAEYDLVNEIESSLVEKMSSSLKQRLTAEPVRLVYQRNMPLELVELLCDRLGISSYDSIIPGGRYQRFKDFIKFPHVGNKTLANKPLPQLSYTGFRHYRNGFDAIRQQDILLYYPYYTFEHVLELMNQASFDPNVTTIKINIYRVAKDSRIIDAMINAAYNGKKVTVVVELQARFDEEANILWAKQLIEAGVHVVFSIPGLKIHAKLFLITCKEGDNLVHYAHIGTGNFNEKTARIYTDFALLTANPEITNEVLNVFNFIENPYKPVQFNMLLISPQNTRGRLYSFIQKEITNAQKGLTSGITLKLNNLTDTELIDKLYEASSAGVKVRLIIRGMCSLTPGIPNLSENIQVISIVDQFLEHARVYIFNNAGTQRVYISSADWMPRNIDYRIEVGVPILEPALIEQILTIIDLQWNDTVKARIIDKELSNQYVSQGNRRNIRSQVAIYDYLNALETKRMQSMENK